MNEGNPEPIKVKLYEEQGETSRFINAEITAEGDLLMTGQDVGKMPKEFWGDSDYEFFVSVPHQYKDDVLLLLIEQVYAGNSKAVDEFKDLLRSRGIINQANKRGLFHPKMLELGYG
ncbi:MAG: hypothetical protein R6U89_07045 [Dehalococcoidia bacterium]